MKVRERPSILGKKQCKIDALQRESEIRLSTFNPSGHYQQLREPLLSAVGRIKTCVLRRTECRWGKTPPGFGHLQKRTKYSDNTSFPGSVQ